MLLFTYIILIYFKIVNTLVEKLQPAIFILKNCIKLNMYYMCALQVYILLNTFK